MVVLISIKTRNVTSETFTRFLFFSSFVWYFGSMLNPPIKCSFKTYESSCKLIAMKLLSSKVTVWLPFTNIKCYYCCFPVKYPKLKLFSYSL